MNNRRSNNQAGFSMFELIIAMVVTIAIFGLCSALIARSFHVRSREDRKSDAIADVQRALNIMTREISNAGMKLPGGLPNVSSNGIVTGDSDTKSIRIVSNLNGLPDSANGYFRSEEHTSELQSRLHL